MWDNLRGLAECRPVITPGYGEALLLPVPGVGSPTHPTFWMVGRYKDQTQLATDLRHNATAQDFIASHAVRFGLRQTDLPPAGLERQECYGSTIAGSNVGSDFEAQRLHQLSVSAKPGQPAPANRRSDREENVRSFWATQTPQSHHIVEFNHLRDLGVSKEDGLGALDHGQLPCVLLMAEFHQRYLSSILKQTHGWSVAQLQSGLAQTYSSLYQAGGVPFRPLWDVSRIILRAAGLAAA
jgi:hypothetical protein